MLPDEDSANRGKVRNFRTSEVPSLNLWTICPQVLSGKEVGPLNLRGEVERDSREYSKSWVGAVGLGRRFQLLVVWTTPVCFVVNVVTNRSRSTARLADPVAFLPAWHSPANTSLFAAS